MSILSIQKKFRKLGNIRTGTKTTSGYPKKLDTFRITSPARGLVQQCADKWGGEVQPWENQWEVITKTNTLPVYVPPQDPDEMSWYELWGSGGIQRRCDGDYDHRNRVPCQCTEDNRQCNAITRLTVMLPDIEGVGVWLLSSTGWNAAQELHTSLETIYNYMQRTGEIPPARLVLEQRSSKKVGEPRYDFAVPVLEILLPMGDVLSLPEAAPAKHLPEPAIVEPHHEAHQEESVDTDTPEPQVLRSSEYLMVEDIAEIEEAEVVDINPELESQLWDELLLHVEIDLDLLVKKTIPDIKTYVKRLYELMERLGLWAEGTYHLNGKAYLKANDLESEWPEFRMGDLGPKKDGHLQAFSRLSFERAKERISEGE